MHFPTTERVSKVSAAERASEASNAEQANEWAVRANERTDERVAQYLHVDFWLFRKKNWILELLLQKKTVSRVYLHSCVYVTHTNEVPCQVGNLGQVGGEPFEKWCRPLAGHDWNSREKKLSTEAM